MTMRFTYADRILCLTSVSPALVAACSFLAAGCRSADLAGLPDRAGQPQVRFVRAQSGGGADAAAADLQRLEAIAARPDADQSVSIGTSQNAHLSLRDAISQLKAIHAALLAAPSTSHRAADHLPTRLAAANGGCDYGTICYVESNSQIMTTGSPPDPRNVGFWSSTYCSGYPSTTQAGGSAHQQLIVNGVKMLDVTHRFYSNDAYANNGDEYQVTGSAESAYLNTTSTCESPYNPAYPDQTYSFASRTV